MGMSNTNEKSEFKHNLGLRIAQLRVEQGLSQRKLSMAIGLDRATLNRIEQGAGNPTIDTLQRIASGLDVPIEALFQGDGTGE